ncbi:hypothetical protein MRX96_012385 [Rhipicephalus microplus]
MEKAFKEGHKDREIVTLFIEENVLYVEKSEYEENEEAVKRHAPSGRNLLCHQTSHHERSHAGSEERSAASSRRYLKNSISSNKIKDASHAAVIAVAGTERCGSEETTGAASRALLYDCPWWTYNQAGNDAASREASNDTALTNSNYPSTDTSVAAAFESIASNVAATLHPWCTTPWVAAAAADTGVNGATARKHGAVSDLPGAEATPGCNPWGGFLATTRAIVKIKMKVVMSTDDHEMALTQHRDTKSALTGLRSPRLHTSMVGATKLRHAEGEPMPVDAVDDKPSGGVVLSSLRTGAVRAEDQERAILVRCRRALSLHASPPPLVSLRLTNTTPFYDEKQPGKVSGRHPLIAPGSKPDPSGNAGIAMGLLFVWGSLSAGQAHTQSNWVHKRWRKDYYWAIGTCFFTLPSLGWRERVTQIGWNSGKHPGHSAILRCRTKGPKPNPSGNGGIAMGLLPMRGSLSAAQAHTQSNSVHKRWRKDYYSDIGTIFFTVPSLGWRERVARSGWNTVKMEKALKEECKDRDIVALFIEENVLYVGESENEENEHAVKHREPSGPNLLCHPTSHYERSHAGGEKCSAAVSQRYLKNSISSNKIKDASDASVIVVAGTE